MIKPHGSDELNPLFVYNTEERHALVAQAETLPSLLLNSAAAANAVDLQCIWSAQVEPVIEGHIITVTPWSDSSCACHN